MATDLSVEQKSAASRRSNPLRRFIFGRPTPSERQEHTRLQKILALPIFASDAISSSVYATQEILLALGVAGVAALHFTIHISLAISILLAVVAISYWQTVFAYPSGGGSYIVSKENIGVKFGLVAAAALLIDYILTVATSIAAGVQNLVSMPFMHGFQHHVILLCTLAVLLLVWANVRGLKESGMSSRRPPTRLSFRRTPSSSSGCSAPPCSGGI